MCTHVTSMWGVEGDSMAEIVISRLSKIVSKKLGEKIEDDILALAYTCIYHTCLHHAYK